MTRIVLCDDDEFVTESVKKIITSFYKNRNYNNFIITAFNCPEIFINEFKKNAYDLIFLDISMKPITGIALAEQIRLLDKKAEIVFLTGFYDYIMTSFDVHPFNYLMKPVLSEKIEAVIIEFHAYRKALQGEPDSVLVLKHKQHTVKVETAKIIYAEHYRNRTSIVTNEEIITSYISLKELKTLLPNHFIQCYQSFVVNLYQIEYRTGKTCRLKNGIEIPIGRAYNESFKTIYFDFLEHIKGFSRKTSI